MRGEARRQARQCGVAPGTGFEMSDAELRAFCALIRKHCGIALSDSKRDLLVSRLSRRLRALGLASFAEYHTLLVERDPRGEELVQMTNCITTNKTDFFREAHHFEELRTRALPELLRRGGDPIRIWSAGCSTGEEAYSIAITAREALGASAAAKLEIVATDIDTEVLAKADRGVYAAASVRNLDAGLQRRHFLRGRGDAAGWLRVRPELRAMLSFERVNLIEAELALHGSFDVIFCRNVMIYFERSTQRELIERFASRLRPGGWLFVGHTENLQWLSNAFEPIANTTYRLRDRAGATPEPAPPGPRQVRIVVGGVFSSRTPAEVRTVLGSCVSACIFDPLARIGGMNHFLLADGRDELLPNRYGVHAMEVLINEIMKLGGERHRLQAKVFGGADVLALGGNAMNVGEHNAAFVRRFLETERIPLVAERLGGRAPLEVRFETHTARAFVRALQSGDALPVARDEAHYRKSIQQRVQRRDADDITVFQEIER